MAYLPSLKAGIIGFENSFLKFRHILIFVRANNFGKSYSILIERRIFCCIRCDEFLERVR